MRRYEKEEMELEDIPLAHKKSISAGRTIIALGNVKESFKNSGQEKKCEGHICRVIAPEKTFNEATVIREDGLVFTICLEAFESVKVVKVKR